MGKRQPSPEDALREAIQACENSPRSRKIGKDEWLLICGKTGLRLTLAGPAAKAFEAGWAESKT